MDLEGKKGEDMDSLFEGMVLFNPAEEKDNGSDDSLTISSCSQSQPLDENLFSDLTLVVDPLQNLEVAEAERDLQSRQGHAPARRRKRSGLRIGYGRDAFSSNDPPHTPSPLPQPISDSDSVGDADAVRVRDTDTDTETLPSITTATATDDPVTVTLTQPSNESENQNRKHQQSSTESSSRSENEISDAAHDSSTESSSAEFRQLKSSIHDKLNHATQLVKSASSARKDSIRNRRKTVENANLASLKHMELEKQLEEACEAEDFERAEKVSDDLSAAEKEKQAFANSLREADAFVDALDLKLQHALDSQLAIEEQCAILLDHYATNALNNADFSMKKASSVYSKEMDQWLSSSEALEVKKMELEIESQFMNEARLELNNTIEHSIQNDKREKEILCKRKDVLMGELEQLLALVKQKEMEIADNDSNLEAVENKINKVVSGFKEMQSSIDVKYDKLQSVLAQVKLETETLVLKKEEIDNFLIREEEMGARLREFVRISTEEAEGYRKIVKLRRSLMSSILKSREDKLTLSKKEEKLSGDVKLFQQEVSAARASLQELSSRKSSIQETVSNKLFNFSVVWLPMASNNHSPPLEILVRGPEDFSLWTGPPFANGQPSIKLEKVKCINAKFSDDGSKLMVTKSNSLISVYDCRIAEEIRAFEVPNVVAAALSPNGTYLQTFQKPSAPQEKNVTLWSIETGAAVHQQSQKNMTKANWPAIQFSSDEATACRLATNEVQFFDTGDFSKGVVCRLRVPGVAAAELSSLPGSHVAAFVPESKGVPASVQIFACGNASQSQPVARRSFFRCSTTQLKWNHGSTGLLVVVQSDVDKTNQSYYGESKLCYLTTDGMHEGLVPLRKDGPIHDAQWSYSGLEFAVVYGFMPAKATLFDKKCNPLLELGTGPYNTIRWNPKGKFLCLAGFGNLPGDMVFWDYIDKKQLGATKAEWSVTSEWSPDGCYFMTATTAPRLQVDNGIKIFHYNGSLYFKKMFDKLYQVDWKPESPGKFGDIAELIKSLNLVQLEDKKPSGQGPPKSTQTSTKASSANPTTQKPAAYRPPHAKNASAIQAELFGETTAETLSKNALRNKKKREKQKEKKAASDASSS